MRNEKFRIGDIVKYDFDSSSTYIVIATKETPLSKEFLSKLTGVLKIDNIEWLATNEVVVGRGFAYKIADIKHFKEDMAVLGEKLKDVFDDDIVR